MRILAYKGTSFTSRLIRLQTRSEYSHVSVQLEDDTVIEAWGRGGVRHLSGPLEAHKEGTHIDSFVVNASVDEERVLGFLNSQLGKKYDFLSVMRFFTRRKSSADDRWFCSELVVEAYRQGGVDLLKRLPSSYASPRDVVISPLLVSV